MSSTIRIAMLNADTPVPVVRPKWGTYGQMFHDLLVAATSRTCSEVKIQSSYHDVVKLEYPESLADVDVVLVTGSAASSYEDQEWIHQLDEYILDVYTQHPRIKIFGSCFGHQIICQSLLKKYGVRVEKDPNGWELGVQEIKLEEQFRNAVGQGSRFDSDAKFSKYIPERMKVQFIHGDHVKIPSPESIPSSWLMVGHTKHCAVQGVYEPSRVLTLQGHFEFDRWTSTEIMKVFGASWQPEVLQKTFEAIDADDDSEAAAEMVLRFFLEKEPTGDTATYEVAKGLLTPPLDA
ncbi:class I glutamine amidotransferase-like protein [Periconia macrospinosa]|uniref:Class I glutamine amidotransferase-like protein n=1 Tax=Periconia macrospinosa TaxID=97972 RepID=A0A2V1E2G0_9PLEO|nr:class I glutamine amidotransferase-like protein [Periconia macrospinosa]